MRKSNLRWWIVSLVSIATVINYIDRNALSVMWPGISSDLGMDKSDYSYILASFTLAYALGQTVFGRIFDVLKTRISFLMSITIWSISIMLNAVATSVTSFSIFRFTLGFGEAGNWPGATKTNAEWFPSKERAFAQGLFNSGAAIGAIISAPLIAYLYEIFGWRATFVVIGAVSLIWVIPWLIIYKGTPEEHPWISEEEKEYILSDQKEQSNGVEERAPSWIEMFQYRQSWGVILARFFIDPIWWLFVAWLPIYLADRFGFNVKEIGIFAWVPYVGAAIGSVSGGWFSGMLIRKGKSINYSRKTSVLIGCFIMFPSLITTAFAATPLAAVLLIACILFGFQFAIGNIQTLPSDFFTGKAVGSLAGVSGTAAGAGVFITTLLIPVITVDSYVPFFILGALLVPFCLAAVFLVGGEVKRIELKQ